MVLDKIAAKDIWYWVRIEVGGFEHWVRIEAGVLSTGKDKRSGF